MTRPVAFWVSVFAALGVVDLWLDTKHNGSTLSEVGRHLFRTDTRAGRIAFVASWLALSAWLLPHILRGPRL
jgi:hypothetical protein